MRKQGDIVYRLEISFDDILDYNESLREKFNQLDILQKSGFIEMNVTSIENEFSEGLAFSDVISEMAHILNERL